MPVASNAEAFSGFCWEEKEGRKDRMRCSTVSYIVKYVGFGDYTHSL